MILEIRNSLQGPYFGSILQVVESSNQS